MTKLDRKQKQITKGLKNMSKKSMEDYFKYIEGKTSNDEDVNMQEAILAIADALHLVHDDTMSNFELIKGQGVLMDTVLNLIEFHKHCPNCDAAVWDQSKCKCKDD